MSAGSRIVTFRIPDELDGKIARAITSANEHTHEEPYTQTTWILKCIKEKLAHLARGKKNGKKETAIDTIKIESTLEPTSAMDTPDMFK